MKVKTLKPDTNFRYEIRIESSEIEKIEFENVQLTEIKKLQEGG